ncbi:hypothetical protein ABPG77_006191 [Micractinium sp. CCAP 211/92]
MSPRAVPARCLRQAASISSAHLAAVYCAEFELRNPGWRAAATSSGSGSGASKGGAIARQRAAGYLKARERRQAAAAAATEDEQPRSRLAEAAAEYAEAQQAFLLSSPSGLGVGAEAAISRAIQEGALDDLPGKGKPLRQEDHGAQFYRVDPLVQAVTRTMGAQNVKPLSLELREELQRELAALRARLAAELCAAKAAEAAAAAGDAHDAHDAASSSSSSSSGSSTGSSWFRQWFGGSASGNIAGSSGGRQLSVAAVREGQHPGLAHAAEHVRQLIGQYNSAVLADKEAFGAFWPLNPAKQLDWPAEVDAALAAVARETATGGQALSSN